MHGGKVGFVDLHGLGHALAVDGDNFGLIRAAHAAVEAFENARGGAAATGEKAVMHGGKQI